MKKLLVLFCVLLFNSAFPQENKDFKDGYDFTATGTEPFWSVKINENKEIYFNSLKDELTFTTGIPEYSETDKDNFSYSGKSDKYKINVFIKKSECSDGMSDNVYPYSVSVTFSEINSNSFSELKGCGQYTSDYRLDDIWVLDKIKDKQFSKDDYETRPYMELKIRDSRVYGNAGCNTFLGKIEIKGHKIAFSKNMNLTKMYCDKISLEQVFINALSGKTLGYTVDNGRLYLYEKDVNILSFYHTD